MTRPTMRPMTRLAMCATLATALATALAPSQAAAHTFPAARTVVVQVERCEVVLLVGYRPGTGEASDAILARAASQPKSLALDTLRATLTAHALGPLALAADGVALVPTAVRTKIGAEPGGARPMAVVLVTYALPAAKTLALASRDPRRTRISWADRASGRVEIASAPAQGRWHDGVASFLLSLRSGGQPSCARSP